jgi:flagellar hook-associated protein 1
MPGLMQILEVARRSLMANRTGLNVTSHNISNASTPGYSRQRVEFEASAPIHETYGYLGTGVIIKGITRLRDKFLDQQTRSANDTFADASVQHGLLSQIEASFNEPSDAGLSAAMTRFFTAFQDLSIHPEESASRNAVLQQGVLLTQSFHRLSSDLTQLKEDLSTDVQSRVDKINQLTKEISELDLKLTGAKAVGADVSDIRDQMDIRIDELSKLADIKITEDSRQSIMISIGGAVIASRAGNVPLQLVKVGNSIQIKNSSSGNDINVSSGELGAVLTTYNSTITDHLSKLNQLADAITARVNTVHAAGFGLGNPPSTNISFFTGTGAAGIEVNSAITSNINLIAASADGSAGNNEIALQIAGIMNEKILDGNSVSVLQYYNGIVSGLGSTINAADNTAKSQELILNQLENQRLSVSGVSLDEEMTNLIKFQRSFDAAARIVTTLDEMMQTLLDMR